MPIDNAVLFSLFIFILFYFVGKNNELEERNEKLKNEINRLKDADRNSDDCESFYWFDFRFTD